MYVCPRCCIQLIALQACCLCAPVFPIVSETHSNITSNTDKIQGKHFHNHFPALSFTTSSPFPLSFPLFLHIPLLNFALCLNSVSEGNWEHVGLSGPIIVITWTMFIPGSYGIRIFFRSIVSAVQLTEGRPPAHQTFVEPCSIQIKKNVVSFSWCNS